ncbi:MAG: dethiobiotin synthase [Methylovulum sp.]|uniref:dethiobiotin synthase n=1 Tax=Methylovulum sp. TaxID=1916980 RepID=UPI0026032FE6|nr:dethiobiotin synthase [Methylovulum sp.]MDD2723826.1 dethiobiotin synthase [Methylovulum sp.]MDD5123704.1 dethiobiotin synthase [Methylovulum sp.]
MNAAYFITGTDTDAGKTWATVALMEYYQQRGHTVAAMKPVAAGCQWQDGRWQNADALLLQHHASLPLPYHLINPYAYELAVSPHLAGVANPVKIDTIIDSFKQIKIQADVVLVEGAGGWYAPINAHQDISNLAKALELPVILIVAIRLGCINHAKLTHQAIAASGLPCAGWIAVCNDADMPMREENIATLVTALASPLLGVVPYQNQVDFSVLARQLHGLG